jgi:chromosome segregation ATPase
MSELLKAADELGKLVKIFSAMETLRPMLAKVGSLEQAAKEAQAVLDAQAKALAESKADIAKAKEDAKKVRADAAAAVAIAVADKDKAVDQARLIVASAEDEAKTIVNSANGYLAAEQAKEKAELESLQAHVKVAAEKLADIERRNEAAKEVLRNLTARI